MTITPKEVSKQDLEKKLKKEITFTKEDVINKKLLVADGDRIRKGEKLTEGLINPRKVLVLKGIRECQRFLVDEVQGVYKQQGVNTNDKHIEIIVKQMLRFVRITEPGDSDLLKGDLVDSGRFEKIHYRYKKAKKRPPKAEPILLGISKASLSTESFLSTASFQETTKVLTNAAVEGKTDYLRGLKENVIIGRLVPVGTGQDRFKDLMVKARHLPLGASIHEEYGDEIKEESSMEELDENLDDEE
jgi:DNA-directed RNA polymerase subunit beta'